VEAAELETETLIDDRFRVQQTLGRGGMGAVYRVRDERTGKELALKRLYVKDERRRALVTSLFEREFHTLAQLAHPRIIEVYDYGIDEQGAYYTMELLDGADLRERGTQPWREVCALLRDVASSLSILHSRKLLHRDLTPRNVRCTSDGRLKLIDFGAMAVMGTPKTVVGTPPFIPPEALQLQVLDARADLFALGALGYWMLTGRHAYPARALGELRDRWRSLPPTPQQIEPSVPVGLSQLVMELLRLDRDGRPASAAEVMERLSAIAGLPMEELPAVTQAYLATPMLVGREQALIEARSALAQLLQGKGISLRIEGEPGMGRSRFLDACVLEAKLLGATVLRADAADGGRGDYGVVRSLAAQLFEAHPEFAREAARPWREVLVHVVEQLGAGESSPAGPAQAAPERRHVQAALRDWLLAVTRSKRVVLAVDDLERADEPSAALLAALAHKSERRGLALLWTSTPSATSPALTLLREIGRGVRLQPLSAEQTETLMRSVFGDVANVVLVGRWVHEVSEGNPRAAMELAQHLVDRKVARYQAGSWGLPPSLNQSDLPQSLSAAHAVRLSALGQEARELGEALSLTDPALLSLQDYPALTGHGDHGRTYRALDELLAAGILIASGERYLFGQRSWADMFSAALSDAHKRELHGRLADVAERVGNQRRLAWHLMEAGQTRRAIELLHALRHSPELGWSPTTLRLVEQAVIHSEALAMPRPLRLELGVLLVNLCSSLGDYQRFLRYAPGMLEQLKRDSGLSDWYALGDGVAPQERLGAAFAQVQQRYDATPEAERGLQMFEALAQLARMCGTFSTMAAVAHEPELVLQLPSLLPFAPLSPAIGTVDLMIDGMRHTLTGRTDSALDIYRVVLDRLDQPDRGGLDELSFVEMRLGMMQAIGLIEATSGMRTAIERVAEMEKVPGHRANAWRVHQMTHLMQGNAEEAKKAQRRAELLQLQDGDMLRYPGTMVRAEFAVHMAGDDLLGVKQSTERLAESAASFPGFRCTLQSARSHYRRLQGDYEGALQEIASVLSEHHGELDQLMVVVTHMAALTVLGRPEEAATLGLQHYATSRCEGLLRLMLVRYLVEALIHAGRAPEALEICDRSIAKAQAQGISGLGIGPLYEMRARVALAMNDEAGFREYAERCAAEYRHGKNPALSAKYQRLVHEAERDGVGISTTLAHAVDYETSGESAAEETSARTVHSRLLECEGSSERARYTLAALLEHTGAELGHLYAVRGGRLERLCSLPEVDAPQGLVETLEAHVQQLLRMEEETTAAGEGSEPLSQLVTGVSDAEGRRFEPVGLVTTRDDETVIAAVAALSFGPQRRRVPHAVLNALAAALIDNDDVDPMTCVA
jgi:tetratricopeptide (TPR) repeat protein